MKYIFILISLLSLLSCKGQTKGDRKNTINEINIMQNKSEILDTVINVKQIEKYSTGEDYTANMSLVKNIELSLPVTYQGLKNNGFEPIKNDEFKNKMKEIFGINLTNKNIYPNLTDYGKFIGYSKKSHPLVEPGQLYESEDFLLVEKYNFITDYIFVEAICTIENDKIKITLPQHIIFRNKYLFNNDRTSLSWLIHNDKSFMENLVINFGYTKDNKLLEWVMKENLSQSEIIVDNAIFVKDYQGKLEVRENILKYIEKTTTNNEANYGIALRNSLLDLIYKKELREKIEWTDEEFYKIVAYASNVSDWLYSKYYKSESVVWGNGDILGTFHVLLSKEWDVMLKQFEKNNYYNLPHLKELVEEGGVY